MSINSGEIPGPYHFKRKKKINIYSLVINIFQEFFNMFVKYVLIAG